MVLHFVGEYVIAFLLKTLYRIGRGFFVFSNDVFSGKEGKHMVQNKKSTILDLELLILLSQFRQSLGPFEKRLTTDKGFVFSHIQFGLRLQHILCFSNLKA
jgi:hypothetical protein